ncbi:hypothetical protein Dimus_030814 [Dionaea muscipula]
MIVVLFDVLDKEEISLVEVETESSKELVVAGSPTIEELDQQVDELQARPFVSEAVEKGSDKDEGGQRDGEEVLEKYALEREVKELKFECDSTVEISSQVKANIEMVKEENQSLEDKNEELKTALEGEKSKVQTL